MFLGRNEISDILEINDPFLMIDEINIDLIKNKAISSKILNKNDWFYACHMPKSPVMPATLQMEGMLQTLVVLIYQCYGSDSPRSYIVDAKTKFHKKVFMQPLLKYYAELISNRRGIFKGKVIGKYNSVLVCEGEFTYASPDLMALPNSKK